MIRTFKILLGIFLLGFIFFSCKQIDNKKKIIGKWKCTLPTNCNDANIGLGGRMEWEFGEKGTCIVKYFWNPGGPRDMTNARSYEIKGDSIYWDLDEPAKERGSNCSFNFVSENSVVLKYGLPSDCIETYVLEKN